jgi:hypothetical protein
MEEARAEKGVYALFLFFLQEGYLVVMHATV